MAKKQATGKPGHVIKREGKYYMRIHETPRTQLGLYKTLHAYGSPRNVTKKLPGGGYAIYMKGDQRILKQDYQKQQKA